MHNSSSKMRIEAHEPGSSPAIDWALVHDVHQHFLLDHACYRLSGRGYADYQSSEHLRCRNDVWNHSCFHDIAKQNLLPYRILAASAGRHTGRTGAV